MPDMNLKDFYDRLYLDSVSIIQSDLYQPDELINSSADNRYGVTLILRPDRAVCSAIELFLNGLRQVEPNQYYYPASDMHVTVMSLISCYNGFSLSRIYAQEYISVIQKSLLGIGPFEIEFSGITASSSCMMVQGFPKDETLTQLRNNLRENFMQTNLEQSLDKRYKMEAAHCTVLRVKEPLTDKAKLLKVAEQYREHRFGTVKVASLQLVFNDWYMRTGKLKELYHFDL